MDAKTGAPILHAGLAACRHGGFWHGVLFKGEPGSGKSDLMIRLLEGPGGFRLVADDRVMVWASGGRLYGRAPDTLSGKLEARGVGVISEPAAPFAEIALIARCEFASVELDRVPAAESEQVLGVATPVLHIHPLEASAPAKLRRAFDRLSPGAVQS